MDLDKLLPALVAAKKNFKPISKDSINLHYKRKYASLAAILDAVEPALLEQSLLISQAVQESLLVTRLYHDSGQFLEAVYVLPNIEDMQKIGSAITYAKRYSICGLLSVVADEDDDAESLRTSSTPIQAKPSKTQSYNEDFEKTSRVRAAREAAGLSQQQVIDLLQSNFGVDKPQKLTTQQVDQLINLIQDKGESQPKQKD